MARRRRAPRRGSNALVWGILGSTFALGVLAFCAWVAGGDPALRAELRARLLGGGKAAPVVSDESAAATAPRVAVTQPLLVGGLYRAEDKPLPIFRGGDPGSLKPGEYQSLRAKSGRIMHIVVRGNFRVMRITEGHRQDHWFYLVTVATDSLEENIDGRGVERWLDGDMLADAGLVELKVR